MINFFTNNLSINCESKGCKTIISLEKDMKESMAGDRIEKNKEAPNINEHEILPLHVISLTTKLPWYIRSLTNNIKREIEHIISVKLTETITGLKEPTPFCPNLNCIKIDTKLVINIVPATNP